MQNPERRSSGRPTSGLFCILHFALCTLTCILVSCSAPAPAPSSRVEFTVKPGMSIGAIADSLVADGVIHSKLAFGLYSWYYHYAPRIKPGRYHLVPGTSERRVLKLLAHEESAPVLITIPDGYTMKQVAASLAQSDVCTDSGFLAACADTATLGEFGVIAPSAEGYLFPETYEFLTGTPPADVVGRMLRQFQSVFSSIPNPQSKTQNPKYPPPLSPSQLVTLASIVEGEAKTPDEFPRIAGVFMNRLRRHMPLQSCATVEYLLPERKGVLSIEDTKFDSPYNTYLHVGLPPGPICNPGRRALDATLNPERNDYLFFVSRGDGTHIFSHTAAEHEAACRLVNHGT